MNLGGTIRLNRVGILIIIAAAILLIIYTYSVDDKRGEKDSLASSQTVNLKQLLIAAVEITERGGKEVVAVRTDPAMQEYSKGKTKEGANVPVTTADLKSHCVMYYNLQHSFPKIKVISEEHAAEKDCAAFSLLDLDPAILQTTELLGDEFVAASDVSVWIDPLDATQEFTESLLEYVTTMACVAVRGRPVIGVVHRPFSGHTSWAWLGHAHSADLAYHKPSGAPRLIVSRSHTGTVSELAHKVLPDAQVVAAGGAGYKALEVVAGNATAYLHSTAIYKWDICAGDAILAAMGGHLTTLENEKIDYSNGKESKNEKGVLATMDEHEFFVEKLKAKAT